MLHGTTNTHAEVTATIATLVAEGRRPVVVWLPSGRVFDVYLCADDRGTLRVVAAMGSANDVTGYDKGGAAWAGMVSGAGYKRFRCCVPPHATATRVVLPSGREVFAV